MKKIVLLLIAGLAFTACEKEVKEEPEAPKEWVGWMRSYKIKNWQREDVNFYTSIITPEGVDSIGGIWPSTQSHTHRGLEFPAEMSKGYSLDAEIIEETKVKASLTVTPEDTMNSTPTFYIHVQHWAWK